MALVVGTNSYVTEVEIQAYADDRGITISGDKTVLGIKAMDYIESRFYSGDKTDEDQALKFPRNGDAEVPADIETAQIVAALLIDSGVDLFASLGQAVKREKVDMIEVEYQDGSGSSTLYPQLNALLGAYLLSGTGGFRVYRV